MTITGIETGSNEVPELAAELEVDWGLRGGVSVMIVLGQAG